MSDEPKRGSRRPPPTLIAFRRSLDFETDRGCVLALTAHLDAELERLLRRYLVDDKKAVNSLLDSGGQKPLSSFSARINMAFALGLIPRDMKNDLHLIRDIRNQFGHRTKVMQLTDHPFADQCDSLKHNATGVFTEPRAKLMHVMMGITGFLHRAQRSTRHRRIERRMPYAKMRKIAVKLIGELKEDDPKEFQRKLRRSRLRSLGLTSDKKRVGAVGRKRDLR